jgi:triosephosphate isomerase
MPNEPKVVIANWKSNKTAEESLAFLSELNQALPDINLENKELVILPSFTSLSACFVYLEDEDMPVGLGAQNISSFVEGAYTGEEAGSQIAEFCEFVLIGHSERRRYNYETVQDRDIKIAQAFDSGLVPIVCVQDENATIPDGVVLVAYEPPSAISTFAEGNHVEDSGKIQTVFESYKQKYPNIQMIYGGSVGPENILSLLQIPGLAGFLIGAASLDADKFISLLKQW